MKEKKNWTKEDFLLSLRAPADARSSGLEVKVALPYNHGDIPISNADLDTPFATFKESADKYPDRKCLGQREFLPDGKRGEYKWQSYSEVWTLCMPTTSRVCDLRMYLFRSFVAMPV